MDKGSRNTLQRATQQMRAFLEADFGEQLEGTLDVFADGTVSEHPGAHLDPQQVIVREKVVAAIGHIAAKGQKPADAVAAYTREAAFTFLNRLVALKLAEARGLVQECVSRGEQSSGFKEFCGLAPGLSQLPDHGYRLYVESLVDELGREVAVLFDRRDPVSLLWPRRQALEDVLNSLNHQDLAGVWILDETIGWIYQYYNDSAERRRMREESAAPRNSRELAVRNQFFTPRYVVEFLTDNTLGRIWYEMRKGSTVLLQRCSYLVRRPSEVFLPEGQEVQKLPEGVQGLSQEELLREPAPIPHRPKKDPREIRMLDPAGGSGHFALYCFDLFEIIYREAWDDPDLGPALRKDFRDRTALEKELPRLILYHNLHLIDIDPRACQIAALALWMRAQRAWKEQELPASQRPRIDRVNVVCAERMPGEHDLLDEFVAGLRPPVLGQVVRVVFDKMQLAGEAGSLLRIEEELKGAIATARKVWLTRPRHEQLLLFPGNQRREPSQRSLLDVSGVTEEQFWDGAEAQVMDALRTFAARAVEEKGNQRSLFAGDSEQGFAFIDICRRRYDVVLMNPPFGLECPSTTEMIRSAYEGAHSDMFSCFIARGCVLADRGLLGSITSRAFLIRRRQSDFRLRWILPSMCLLLDLGSNVMDEAMVQSCAFVLRPDLKSGGFLVFDWRNRPDSERTGTQLGLENARMFPTSRAYSMPFYRIVHALPEKVVALFESDRVFDPTLGTAREGMKSFDNSRFVRLFWEVPPGTISFPSGWVRFAKGGEACAYHGPMYLVLNRRHDGAELDAVNLSLNRTRAQVRQASAFWGQPGCTYSRRSKYFGVRALPTATIFSDKGPAVLPQPGTPAYFLLAWLNSVPVRALVHLQANASDYLTGIVKTLPCPNLESDSFEELRGIGMDLCRLRLELNVRLETDSQFAGLPLGEGIREGLTRSHEAATNSSLKTAELELRATQLASLGYGVTDLGWAHELLQDDSDEASEEDEELEEQTTEGDAASSFVSLMLGSAFGRWDCRFATGEKPVPELPDPFAPLPVCPPGQLQNEHGLPMTKEDVGRLNAGGRWDYPIEIAWDGILVDDPGHPLDAEARVQQVMNVIWGDRREAIEREACEILGVHSLRDYFRKSASFFADHLKRYSKSRRQAPIYWRLGTPTASYTVWLYYHRFTKDTFYKVLNDFVIPKLQQEERKLVSFLQSAGGRPTASQRTEVAGQERFVEELRAFREEVARVAPLWNPDLNDGVIINFAPLWRLAPQHRAWQKECKDCWDKLVAGEYDWSHLAMHLWPERVVPKCAADRSLAIAHGLDNEFWLEDSESKWKPRKVEKAKVAGLIAKRESPTVRAALESLMSAPVVGGVGGRGRRARRATTES